MKKTPIKYNVTRRIWRHLWRLAVVCAAALPGTPQGSGAILHRAKLDSGFSQRPQTAAEHWVFRLPLSSLAHDRAAQANIAAATGNRGYPWSMTRDALLADAHLCFRPKWNATDASKPLDASLLGSRICSTSSSLDRIFSAPAPIAVFPNAPNAGSPKIAVAISNPSQNSPDAWSLRAVSTCGSALAISAPFEERTGSLFQIIAKVEACRKPICCSKSSDCKIFCYPVPHNVSPPVAPIPISNPIWRNSFWQASNRCH